MFERTDKGLGDFPKTLKDEPNPNWQNCQFLGLENSFKNRKVVPPCYACQCEKYRGEGPSCQENWKG